MATGIEIRHSRDCRAKTSGRCNCRPSYQAAVWSNRDRKRIRKTFATLGAAKAWRRDALTALERGTMRAPSPVTVRAAADAYVAGMRDGTIRSREGDPFKPWTIRSYEKALRLRVLPDLGDRRLSDVRRTDVQDLADRLLAEGHSPATIQLTVASLRAVCRRAVKRSQLAINPCDGVEMPAVRNGRDRIASPEEASKLLAALPEEERPLWTTAFYSGLRRGELIALRWTDVDLKANVIRVERAWDPIEGPIAPKTSKGRRTVPIADVLREHLVAHRLRSGGRGLAFGNGDRPLRSDAAQARADAAWKEADLPRITLHECRHTFASLMIAAGVNAKSLSEYMGHSGIAITMDRYGHLMPGNEAEAAGLLDAYLKRATVR